MTRAGAKRFTTVHSRYHVLGFIGGEGELAETCQTRTEAFRVARAYLGPRDYERVQVFDSMARLGAVELWELEAVGAKPLEVRLTVERNHARPGS